MQVIYKSNEIAVIFKWTYYAKKRKASDNTLAVK